MGLFSFFKKADKKRTNYKEVNTLTKIPNKNTMDHDIEPIYKKKLNKALLPGEIVLLEWIVGKTVDSTFPRYFETKYGIDARKSAFKLVHEGCAEYANPIEALSSLKVPELKEILKTKSLKTTGNKRSLIERCEEHLSFDEVSNHIDKIPIKLTVKGEQVLEQYYYIIPAHRNDSKDGIYNVATAIKHVNSLNYKPGNGDISWALFQEALIKYQEKFQHGLERNVFSNMASQLYKEKKYRDSLEKYFWVFIIDLSGLNNSRYLTHPKHILAAPGITSRILKTIENLDIDKSQTKEEFSNAWSRVRPSLIFHYLDEEICFQCLLADIEEQGEYIQDAIMHSYRNVYKSNLEKDFDIKLPIHYEE